MGTNGCRELAREIHRTREGFIERAHLPEHGLFDPDVLTHARRSRRDDQQRRRQLIDERRSISDEKLLARFTKNTTNLRISHSRALEHAACQAHTTALGSAHDSDSLEIRSIRS